MTTTPKLTLTPNKLAADRLTSKKVMLTHDLISVWKAPPFQRPLLHNQKLENYTQQLLQEATIETPIHLGLWEKELYVINGQHRLEAFRESGLVRARGLIVIKEYPSGSLGLLEMSEDYVRLNQTIAQQRPDDFLRAIENTNPFLQVLRKSCPFIGYDQVRHSTTSPVLSMALVLRAWHGSANEVPGTPKSSAIDNARRLTVEDCEHLTQFVELAFAAWGREFNNRRLWASLNLTLCMWLYRRVVMTTVNSSSRSTKLTPEQFQLGLRGLAGSASYVEWLTNRGLHERERSPAYGRLRQVFVGVLNDELKRRVLMPSPPWYAGRGS